MSRSTQIQVRLTPEEKGELEAKAARHGLSVSAYLRRAGLGADVGGGGTAERTQPPAAADVSPKAKGPVASIFEGDDG